MSDINTVIATAIADATSNLPTTIVNALSAAGYDIVPQSAPASPPPSPPPAPTVSIDLANWKITLPIDANGGTSGDAMEVKQPQLATYENAPWFVRLPDGRLQFRAHCGGATTSGSEYPRCELREMNADGTLAKWSPKVGRHHMAVELSIDAVPPVKPHVVFAQVHGGSDDITVLLYDHSQGGIRWKKGDSTQTGILMPYTLGTKLKVDCIAEAGYITWFLNGVQKGKIASISTSAYFKTPCYVLSNESRGDAPEAYGQCTLHSLAVTHA